MSDGAASGGTSAGGGSPAPGGSAAASPSQVGPTPDQKHNAASQALQERVQARRDAADKMIGFDDETRGADGKFKAKADKAAKGSSDSAKAKTDPEETSKTKEADAEESPAAKKLKGEHEALTKRYADLEQKNAQWEEMGEQVLARLKSYAERVQYLESKLAEHGGQPDAGFIENLSLKEKLHARELQDQRIAAMVEKQAEEARQEALKQEQGQLVGAFQKIWNEHPELRPPFSEQNSEAARFWQGIQQAIKGGATFTELAPTLAGAATIAASLKAKAQPAAKPKVAPPTILGRTQAGGEPRQVDRYSIVEKHKARLRAG